MPVCSIIYLSRWCLSWCGIVVVVVGCLLRGLASWTNHLLGSLSPLPFCKPTCVVFKGFPYPGTFSDFLVCSPHLCLILNSARNFVMVTLHMWRHKPVSLGLWKLRQEDPEFKASLGYTEKPYLKQYFPQTFVGRVVRWDH